MNLGPNGRAFWPCLEIHGVFLLLIRGKSIIQNTFTTRAEYVFLLRRLRWYIWIELQWIYQTCQVRVNHRSQQKEQEVSCTCSWQLESKWTSIWQKKMCFNVKNIHTVYRHASEYICTVHVYFSMQLHHICMIYMNFNSWVSSLFQCMCFCHIMTFFSLRWKVWIFVTERWIIGVLQLVGGAT